MPSAERMRANFEAIRDADGARITRIAATASEAKIELDNGTVLDFSPFLFPGQGRAMGLRIDCRRAPAPASIEQEAGS